jgi:hypothetical protein
MSRFQSAISAMSTQLAALQNDNRLAMNDTSASIKD